MVPSRPDTLGNRSLEGRPSSVTLPTNAKTAHNGAKGNSKLRSQPGHSGVQKSAEMKSSETAPEAAPTFKDRPMRAASIPVATCGTPTSSNVRKIRSKGRYVTPENHASRGYHVIT